jgi:DNA invertase Pin-like site-specific DNA recombinase
MRKELKPAIEYVRVSTKEQGKSGVEARREHIDRFAKAEGFRIVFSTRDTRTSLKFG